MLWVVRRYRRWKAEADFEIYLRVWLLNSESVVGPALNEITKTNAYRGIIDDLEHRVINLQHTLRP